MYQVWKPVIISCPLNLISARTKIATNCRNCKMQYKTAYHEESFEGTSLLLQVCTCTSVWGPSTTSRLTSKEGSETPACNVWESACQLSKSSGSLEASGFLSGTGLELGLSGAWCSKEKASASVCKRPWSTTSRVTSKETPACDVSCQLSETRTESGSLGASGFLSGTGLELGLSSASGTFSLFSVYSVHVFTLCGCVCLA